MNRCLRQFVLLILVGIMLMTQTVGISAQDGELPPDSTAGTPATTEPSPIVSTEIEIDDFEVTIFWQTSVPMVGWIEYGVASDQLSRSTYDPVRSNIATTDHSMRLEGLTPGTTYYAIVSVQDDGTQVREFYKLILGEDPYREGGEPAFSANKSLDPFDAIASPAACPVVNCTAGKDVGRDYFSGVVTRLSNVPLSTFAVDALMAWKPYENTNACWNPLATTWKMEEVCNFNSVGVQNYQNQDMGTRATANTLNLSYYDAIRKMLRREAFDREALRRSLGTWGTCRDSKCDSLLNKWQELWNTSSSDPDDERTIGNGQTLSGTINPANDEDTYYFDATSGQSATIRMNKSNSSLDSYLYLYAPNGSLVAENDDGGGDLNSLINQVTLSQTGRYRIRAKSYNGGSTGGYTLSLSITSSVSCNSSQYRAEYFNNRTLSGTPTFVRCENWPINFDWGNGGPGNGVGTDNFSVRWTGSASFSAGNYTFIAKADDGVRAWLDNTQIIDGWRDQGATEYRSTRSVSSGTHNIKVEYYENGGGALIQFRWEQASTSSGNLARGKSAYATSWQSSSYPPYKGNDGATSTRWSSAQSNSLPAQWWEVDLGSRQTFDRVTIRWEAAYATRYYVGWSDDGTNYTGYYYNRTSPGVYTHDIGSRTARWVGVYMINRASGMTNFSFWETEVYRTSRSMQDPTSTGEQIDLVVSDADVDGELVQPEGDLIAIERTSDPAQQPDVHELFLPFAQR